MTCDLCARIFAHVDEDIDACVGICGYPGIESTFGTDTNYTYIKKREKTNCSSYQQISILFRLVVVSLNIL